MHRLFVPAIVLILVAGAAYLIYSNRGPILAAETGDVSVESEAPPAPEADADLSGLEQSATARAADPVVIGPCNLYPVAEQDVPSQVDGVCESVAVALGQQVREGELLAQIDDRDLRPQVELLRIKASSTSAELIAKAMFDEAEGKVNYALRANKSGLKAVPDLEHKKYLAERERYAQEMKKAVEERQIAAKELERVNRLLTRHEVRSALDGEVVKIHKRNGEAVKQGEAMFRVARFDRIRVEGLCQASQAAALRVGMSALVEAEVPSEAITRLSAHTAAIHCLATSLDGRLLASASEDQSVILWTWPRGGQAGRLSHPGEVYAVTFVPDASKKPNYRVLTGCSDGQVRLWSWDQRGKPEQAHAFAKAHDGAVRALACSPDGKYVVSGGEDRRVGVWDLASGEHLYWLGGTEAHRGAVTSVHVTLDGVAVSAGRDNALRFWKLTPSGGKLLAAHLGRTGDVAQLGTSPDGRLALFDHGEEMRLLRLKDGSCPATLKSGKQGHFQGVAAFSPTASFILTGASNGRLQLWKAPAESEPTKTESLAQLSRTDSWEVRHFLAPRAGTTCATFAPDESVIFTAGTDRLIHVWPVPAARLQKPLEAKITFIGSQVERGTSMVRVRAELTNPTDAARRLRPGTFANLRLYP